MNVYGNHARSGPTCEYWFQCFKSDHFDVNAMVPQKSSKMGNLRDSLILIHVRYLKNCLQHWMLIDLPLENACMHWELFRRQEIGYHTS
ncbi:hypothetical protein Trydic_g19738 [Trypoxylus dichotomus]